MKLNKKMLIKAARAAIQRQKDAQVEWDRNVEEAKAAHQKAWETEMLPQWRTLRDEITKALKTGGPITRAMLPQVQGTRYYDADRIFFYTPFNAGAYRNGHWQDATHNLGPRPVYQVRNLESLLDFLETVEDETVTVAGLERVGFRNMAYLMDAVKNAQWEV